MNKHTFIALSVASALGMTPFTGFADDLKPQKHMEPATLSYPVMPNRTDAAMMVGHVVEDILGNKVGDIEGIHIGKDGKVTDVVIGIGGFLGVGQRDILMKWSQLRIIKGGDSAGAIDKIVVSATKDQLKSMTAYRFDRPDQRRTVFDSPM
jgi:hypothetical protein